MITEDSALAFTCQGAMLYGILSMPAQPYRRGVLIVTGGPQYRVGSHRQFTLLARHLAQNGIPAMRFDYRGMGDSEGRMHTFEEVGEDLRVAADRFVAAVPGMNEIVIWGLCDSASAAMFYAWQDHRVSGLVLLNPWARTEKGMARAYMRHYYLSRLLSQEFWKKMGQGNFNYGSALRAFAGLARNAFGVGKKAGLVKYDGHSASTAPPLPDRLYDGLSRFKGRVLLVTSGNDLTSREFLNMAAASRRWKSLLSAPRVQRFELADANHTFSRAKWRDSVAIRTSQWVRSW